MPNHGTTLLGPGEPHRELHGPLDHVVFSPSSSLIQRLRKILPPGDTNKRCPNQREKGGGGHFSPRAPLPFWQSFLEKNQRLCRRRTTGHEGVILHMLPHCHIFCVRPRQHLQPKPCPCWLTALF